MGDKCDRCSEGFYNFPNCRPCNCHPGGTIEEACSANQTPNLPPYGISPESTTSSQGQCSCDQLGSCQCKPKAEGKKCASCQRGTFGLSKENPEGCFDCFCFGRSSTCQQADYVWTQLSAPGGRHLTISRGQTQLQAVNDLFVITGQEETVKIGVESVFTSPLYWSLPDKFLGDKVLSYNGYLRFAISSNGKMPYSPGVLEQYPLVQLQGNHRIVLEHFPRKRSSSGRYEVR